MGNWRASALVALVGVIYVVAGQESSGGILLDGNDHHGELLYPDTRRLLHHSSSSGDSETKACKCNKAKIKARCDNALRFRYYVDGTEATQNGRRSLFWDWGWSSSTSSSSSSSSSYDLEDWEDTFETDVSIEGQTRLEFECTDTGSPGGFMAEVKLCGDTFGTMDTIVEDSNPAPDTWFVDATKSSTSSTMKYVQYGGYPWYTTGDNGGLKNSDYFWVWNSDSENTLTFGFNIDCEAEESAAPTGSPSASPSEQPTVSPTASPTTSPTQTPTETPTTSPTVSPTASPTTSPTQTPTETPTTSPTASPTTSPTQTPTAYPTDTPTLSPTEDRGCNLCDSATIRVRCDNRMRFRQYQLRGDGVLVQQPSDRVGDWDITNWRETFETTISITPETRLEFECNDIGVVGGFVGEIEACGTTIMTSTDLVAQESPVPFSWFVNPSKTDPSETALVYTPMGEGTWGETGTGYKDPDAIWVWNGDIDNTMTFGFDFGCMLTEAPTSFPTQTPTETPTTSPTVSPTASPTASPTQTPTETPTTSPTVSPTASPTTSPTQTPTETPTTSPTVSPTASPTTSPTQTPTETPTTSPTVSPTASPTTSPTQTPTETPTTSPTASPTTSPTQTPTAYPTDTPTLSPTEDRGCNLCDSATIRVRCDNRMRFRQYQLRGDGVLVQQPSDRVGDWDITNWRETFETTISITPETRLEFECNDIGVVGGFVGEIEACGTTIMTSTDLVAQESPVPFSWFVNPSKTDPSETALVYTPMGEGRWGETGTGYKDPDAIWVWNGDIDNTMTFGFDFGCMLTDAPTTSPTQYPTASPTAFPTNAPTLRPVEVIPGCHVDQKIYRATSADRLETIKDDPGVQTPEQCQATCLENAECQYWSFRMDSGNSDSNAVAQCNLMAALNRIVDGSARWASGPRVCTSAPTLSPTSNPTDEPTAAPTQFPTQYPTASPTRTPTAFPTASPTQFPTEAPTLGPVEVLDGCHTNSVKFTHASGGFLEAFHDNPRIQTPEQCQSKCQEVDDCSHWAFLTPDATAYVPEARCNLIKVRGEDVADPSGRWTSGPRECTLAPTSSPTASPTLFPTDSPTLAPTDRPTPEPTFAPVVQRSGCIQEQTRHKTTSGGIAGYWANEDAVAQGILSAENCHAKCEEVEDCKYWSYFDAANKNCKLFKFVTETVSGSAYTSGPKFCTAAPTSHPTDAPTQFPTDSPTLAPTDRPTPEPTFAPVVQRSGCIQEQTRHKTTSGGIAGYWANEDAVAQGILSAENCHAKCEEVEDCKYWSYFDAANKNCKLFKFVTETVSGSAYTSGPKFCTDAPTSHPSVAPTSHPSVAPTSHPSVAPTQSPTDEAVVEEETTCFEDGFFYRSSESLGAKVVQSIEACQLFCETKDACTGYYMHKTSKRCYLKGGLLTRRTNSNYIAATRECPQPADCVQQFGEIRGKIVKRTTADSAIDCAGLCLELGACKTWRWRASDSTCILRSSVGTVASRNSDFFTGVIDGCASQLAEYVPATEPPTLVPVPDVVSCTHKVNDVAFILDGSKSINDNEWAHQVAFVRQLGSAFRLGTTSSDSRLAMIEFSARARTVWDFSSPNALDEEAFQIAADGVEQTKSATGTGGALITAQELFWNTPTRTNLDRRVAIILTDGQPNVNRLCPSAGYNKNAKVCTKQAAADLRKGPDGVLGTDDDVYLVYVRVGGAVRTDVFNNVEDLQVGASPAGLSEIANQIIIDICDIDS